MYPWHPLPTGAESSSTSKPEDPCHQGKGSSLFSKHHCNAHTDYTNAGAVSALSFLFPGNGYIPQKPRISNCSGLREVFVATASVNVDAGGADKNAWGLLGSNGGFDQPPSPLDAAVQDSSLFCRSPKADDRLAGEMD
jgi:hypothetical protein